MKIKTLILTIYFLLSFTGGAVSAFSYSPVKSSSKTHAITNHAVTPEFIRVRVLVNGVWYIYVYALDGSLIIIYPDPDE